MSRIDEMIYHLEAMAKSFKYSMATTMQSVEGSDKPCCIMCGHCPEAEAEWLRAIKKELQANTKPKSKLAQDAPKSNVGDKNER